MTRHHKPLPGTGLGARHRNWLYVCFVFLFLSGALWLGFHYFGRVTTPMGDAPHPAEPWWMRVHGFAAMMALVLFGSLMPQHIRGGWLARKRRLSGGAMFAAMTLLAVSGYGLYYLVDEGQRGWASAVHWSVGLALLPAALVHVLFRREAHRHAHLHAGAHANVQPNPSQRKARGNAPR